MSREVSSPVVDSYRILRIFPSRVSAVKSASLEALNVKSSTVGPFHVSSKVLGYNVTK